MKSKRSKRSLNIPHTITPEHQVKILNLAKDGIKPAKIKEKLHLPYPIQMVKKFIWNNTETESNALTIINACSKETTTALLHLADGLKDGIAGIKDGITATNKDVNSTLAPICMTTCFIPP
jgi:hypothetical protein